MAASRKDHLPSVPGRWRDGNMPLKSKEVRRALRITDRSGPDAVAALGPVWRALQARCPQTTPWQTWEWNDAWWRHFGGRKRPRVLLFHVHGSETPVGIAPLYTGSYLMTPLRRLAWIGTGQSDYLGPLALPEHERAVCEALLDTLHRGSRGWDIADLQQVRPDSAFCTSALANGRGMLPAVLPMEPCPYVPLPSTWEAMTARLGKKMRSNLG